MKFTEEQEINIITDFKNGMSLSEIATKYDTYPMKISRILKLHEITVSKNTLRVKDGEKLIEWAKKQGRLVTKNELAEVLGRKKLSPSYFIRYPELGKYIATNNRKELETYNYLLYDWLRNNNIPFKPKDKTALDMMVDALLLGEYSGIAIYIAEKPKNMSRKIFNGVLKRKRDKAAKAGISMIYLHKKDFSNLDELKKTIDSMKK